jgi:hypothetical protein
VGSEDNGAEFGVGGLEVLWELENNW